MLAVLNLGRYAGSVGKSAGRLLTTPVFILAKFSYRYLLFPVYALGLTTRGRVQKRFRPAKNKYLYPFIAKPLIHLVVILLIFAVTAANLHARTLPSGNGESSLLFGLVAGDDLDLIEETATLTRAGTSVSYLSPAFGVGTSQMQETEVYIPADSRLALLTSGGTAVAVAPSITGALREESRPRRIRTDVQTYVVQSGDTVSTIAAEFGLLQNTLLWANNMTTRSVIRPGQQLKILPVDGVMYSVKKGDTLSKLAKNFSVSEADITTYNKLEDEAPLSVSQDLIIPGGRPQAAPVPTQIARATPAPIIEVIKDALGRPGSSPDSTSISMIWPTSGKVITQYWGWKHTGVDIDGHYDSPIYASESGVVEVSGWGRGYGIQAVLNHENGYKTRYAHMSKIFVSSGDRVTKGDVIGMVGTTGNSTGTHLHFEIYLNGARKNPLLYVR